MIPFDLIRDGDLVLDNLPDDVAASIQVRDAQIANLGMGGALGLEFLVTDVQRWRPGQTVRVAFLDGDTSLHREIAEATRQITDSCNIQLDFGEDGSGAFRRWSEDDTEYAAEIRVSFDKSGYFSLVGIDSVDKGIGSVFGRVGGRPNQASLNLGGFAIQKPSTWRGTARHEFLHALGFHHSHQNMRGPCQASFRWDDDAGYQPTQDDRGMFVADQAGRRPGIYTYLAGFPNFWNKSKVDHNLKTEEDPNLVAGPFDRSSVMLYRFPQHFYRTVPSSCAPVGDGQSLSEGDKRGLRLLYPETAAEVAAVETRQDRLASALAEAVLGAGPEAGFGAESVGGAAQPTLSETVAAIHRKSAEMP